MRKTNKIRKAQTIVEYSILFIITIVAVVSAAFFTDIKESFSNHFDYCVEEILK